MTDTPDNTQDPFAAPPPAPTPAPADTTAPSDAPAPAAAFAAAPTTRRGMGAGGIAAIIVAGVLVAGAIVTAALVFATKGGDVVAQEPSPSPSNPASASPTPSPSPSVAPGQLAIADGRYLVAIDPTWEPFQIPGVQALYEDLGEWGGSWQSEDAFVIMVGVVNGEPTDEAMQQLVLSGMRGGASNVGADGSIYEVSEDFGTSASGLRTLSDSSIVDGDQGSGASSIRVVAIDGAIVIFVAAGAPDEDAVNQITATLVDSMTTP